MDLRAPEVSQLPEIEPKLLPRPPLRSRDSTLSLSPASLLALGGKLALICSAASGEFAPLFVA